MGIKDSSNHDVTLTEMTGAMPVTDRQRAITMHQDGDYEAALKIYQKLIIQNPNDAAVWNNMGVALRLCRHYQAAIICSKRSLEINPDDMSCRSNLGNSLSDVMRGRDAIEAMSRAGDVVSITTQAEALSYSRAAISKNHPKLACDIMERGVTLFPDDVTLKLNLGIGRMMQGDMKKGLEEYEIRWDSGLITKPKRASKEWNGESLKGKTILLFAEQGLGDFLMICRYIPELRARGAKTVRLVLRSPLIRLFENRADIDEIYARNADPKTVPDDEDYFISAMSLIRVLDCQLDNLPDMLELTIPKDSAERAKAITAPYGQRLKVGICWGGSVTFAASHLKAVPFRRFLPLAEIPGLQLFSLYKGPLEHELHDAGAEGLVVESGATEKDLADTAALIKELDLVITIDTSIAHLAGTLGVPVWNLLHAPHYWVWNGIGEQTPWYKSMRLIRQLTQGDWDSVFTRVTNDLNLMLT